jgi:hypothetical protein
VGIDRTVTRGQRGVARIEELEILLQHKQMFRAIVAGQRGGNVRLRRATAMVSMLGEADGITLASHEIPEDP